MRLINIGGCGNMLSARMACDAACGFGAAAEYQTAAISKLVNVQTVTQG